MPPLYWRRVAGSISPRGLTPGAHASPPSSPAGRENLSAVRRAWVRADDPVPVRGIARDESATRSGVRSTAHTPAPQRRSLVVLALGVAPLATPVAVPPLVALPSLPLDSWAGLDLIIGAGTAARGRARPPQDGMHG